MLFLDEIHRMSRSAEEMLYLAMEDFRVDVIVGKGPGATAIPLELPPFTVVGATTRAGLLPAPLRDRFGFTGHLDFYADRRAGRPSCERSARLLGVEADDRRHHRDRPAVPRHTPHRQPAAAPGPRLGPGARPAGRRPGGRARRAGAVRRRRARPGPARPGRARRRCAAASAGGRSGSRPWPSPWGRRPTPSRRSPSRSSSARASSSARPRAGPRRRWPGSTSGSTPPQGYQAQAQPPARHRRGPLRRLTPAEVRHRHTPRARWPQRSQLERGHGGARWSVCRASPTLGRSPGWNRALARARLRGAAHCLPQPEGTAP